MNNLQKLLTSYPHFVHTTYLSIFQKVSPKLLLIWAVGHKMKRKIVSAYRIFGNQKGMVNRKIAA